MKEENEEWDPLRFCNRNFLHSHPPPPLSSPTRPPPTVVLGTWGVVDGLPVSVVPPFPDRLWRQKERGVRGSSPGVLPSHSPWGHGGMSLGRVEDGTGGVVCEAGAVGTGIGDRREGQDGRRREGPVTPPFINDPRVLYCSSPEGVESYPVSSVGVPGFRVSSTGPGGATVFTGWVGGSATTFSPSPTGFGRPRPLHTDTGPVSP